LRKGRALTFGSVKAFHEVTLLTLVSGTLRIYLCSGILETLLQKLALAFQTFLHIQKLGLRLLQVDNHPCLFAPGSLCGSGSLH
jgi:hypothetical protein